MSVEFLNLTTLIGVSIALNFTFRELKFLNLYDRKFGVVAKIIEILGLKKGEAIPDEFEDHDYGKLLHLCVPSKGNRDIWEPERNLGLFYNHLIYTKLSLRIVNISIIFNVFALLLCTYLSQNKSAVPEFGFAVLFFVLLSIFSFPILKNYFENWIVAILFQIAIIFVLNIFFYASDFKLNANHLWLMLFTIISLLTLMPMFFTRMATLCERFLLDEDGKNGIITLLGNEVANRKARRDEITDEIIKKSYMPDVAVENTTICTVKEDTFVGLDPVKVYNVSVAGHPMKQKLPLNGNDTRNSDSTDGK